MEASDRMGWNRRCPLQTRSAALRARSERYNCKGGCTTDAAWRGLRRRTLKRTYMDLGVTDSAWGGTAVLDELRAGI